MLAIGAGGLDVALAMAGEPFYLTMPQIVRVELKGRLLPWVSAKDVILEMLRRLTVKGGVGRIFEYGGEGAATLSVPERATICNMGAELGATSSLFAGDERTREYLRAQKREQAWVPLSGDEDAEYDDVVEIDLSALEPLIALPSSPDNVVPVREVAGTQVAQVILGSCTNSSYIDLMTVAAAVRGKTVPPNVSAAINPGSRQALMTIAQNGALAGLIASGFRILECSCGPCIGMGQAPATGTASLRTFNRNFPGRSGTTGDAVYLCSPQVAAATALTGVITDPRGLGEAPQVELPAEFWVDDGMIIPPSDELRDTEVVRGPNIKPLPLAEPLPDVIRAPVLLKTGDNISTDDIAPAGAKLLPLRSNIPAMAEHAFERIDPTLAARARETPRWLVVGGGNYGQGSSREHAALAPLHLGLKMVLAKSFARIHAANLVNAGILALVFEGAADYERVAQGDELEATGLREALTRGPTVRVRDLTQGFDFTARHSLSPRQVEVVLAGGALNYVKTRGSRGAVS
jgi:aconitate hydratase